MIGFKVHVAVINPDVPVGRYNIDLAALEWRWPISLTTTMVTCCDARESSRVARYAAGRDAERDDRRRK